MSTVVIGADTRVAELLEAHPEAEEILIRMAPQFKALKNPVLRRTVAKVATLEQAARVAGLSARDLVLALRSELGVDGGNEIEGVSADGVAAAPGWVPLNAEPTVDGGALLEAGETPVAKVSAELSGMSSGEVLVISAPFQPAPLIDSLRAKGNDVYAREEEDTSWRVWVRKTDR